ncbi:hypothetical protein ACJX0J_036137 [Zea mays]
MLDQLTLTSLDEKKISTAHTPLVAASESGTRKGGPPSKPNVIAHWKAAHTRGTLCGVPMARRAGQLSCEDVSEWGDVSRLGGEVFDKMTFASECYKLVVVIALLRISIWEVRWKTGAFKSRLFLPIWDTPPSHDNHSASTKDGFSIDFRTYRDLLFH